MKIKISFINIITDLLFIIAFYFGTMVEKLPEGFPADFSANAAMDFTFPKEGIKEVALINSIIPLHFKISSKKEIRSNNNYTTDIPVLTSGQNEKVEIKNDSGYEVDIEEILMAKPSAPEGAAVLIVHTHTSEAYTKDENDFYEESEPYRTQNSDKNIVAVGRELSKVLEERGIKVYHDETYHDYPSYTGSYKRSLETVQKNLKEHPEILLVLDIHRDALQNESKAYMKTKAEEGCAQAMIVIGTDAGGLEHKNWRENLSWGLKIQEVTKKKYPSLMRNLHLCAERYNTHTSGGSMIIEVGSNGNTLPEALKCIRLLGECIGDAINN